jgi:hypothetical protein
MTTAQLLWGEVWRIGLTVLALLAILGVWALILPSLQPFVSTFTPSQVEAEKARAARYKGLHRWSVRVDVLFFVWLVVEGFFLVPYLFTHYGLR